MLEKLTKEQEELIPVVKQEWLDLFYKGKLNEEKLRKGVKWLYQFCGYKEPQVFIMDSILGTQVMISSLNNIRDNIRNNIRNNIGDNIRKNIRNNIGKNIWNNIGDNIRKNIRNNIRNNIGENYINFSWYGNIWDYSWVSFYDYFSRIGQLKNKDFENFRDLLKAGFYDMVQLENYCIISKLPIKAIQDSQDRLSSVKEAAIQWEDGFEMYFVDGINFTPEIGKKIINNQLTGQDILNEQNQERKMIMLEKLGNEKFLKDVKAELIDEDKEYQYKLFKIPEQAPHIFPNFLQYLNTTDSKIGYLKTPPNILKCREAMAWTYELSEPYIPFIRT